jgi:hypothetical protein
VPQTERPKLPHHSSSSEVEHGVTDDPIDNDREIIVKHREAALRAEKKASEERARARERRKRQEAEQQRLDLILAQKKTAAEEEKKKADTQEILEKAKKEDLERLEKELASAPQPTPIVETKRDKLKFWSRKRSETTSGNSAASQDSDALPERERLQKQAPNYGVIEKPKGLIESEREERRAAKDELERKRAVRQSWLPSPQQMMGSGHRDQNSTTPTANGLLPGSDAPKSAVNSGERVSLHFQQDI